MIIWSHYMETTRFKWVFLLISMVTGVFVLPGQKSMLLLSSSSWTGLSRLTR